MEVFTVLSYCITFSRDLYFYDPLYLYSTDTYTLNDQCDSYFVDYNIL